MEVLVAGAGPSGLVLALWLARRGVPVRIVDKAKGPGETSRAMGVQARTLEFYKQLGFADEVVSSGMPVRRFEVYEDGKEVANLDIADFGLGISPYPFLLSYPQDEHERLLGVKLKEAGVEVEWETKLAAFEESDGGVSVSLRRGSDFEKTEFSYLCGCDGAHSVVRQQLGIGFPGGTYETIFFVADVVANGAVSENGARGTFDEGSILLVLPVRSNGHFRLIGNLPTDRLTNDNLQFADIQEEIERRGSLKVEKTEWFSRYKVHHRVAHNFRVGRCFLCGDAGHIHSPVGGQGMNTGIGDAINLAWKLAEVAKGAEPAILDTYEPERIAFARSLVNTTDRIFSGVLNAGLEGHLFRDVVVAHIAPFALGFPCVKHAAFKAISQTRIDYRESSLSDGAAGQIHGGDRLPWVGENFEPLALLEWQVHVYGELPVEIEGVPVHTFPWGDAAEKAGFAKDALYLVRPDGYVALADARPDAERVKNYLAAARGTG
jgi:2-polyprenyl-6-methoxyphenol hydroxylase-like FAD-dependent oxidoreductase